MSANGKIAASGTAKANGSANGSAGPARAAPAGNAALRETVGFAAGGLLFGFFLQKGRVYEPRLIQDQMLLRDFSMMEMFLAAVGASAAVFAAAEHLDLAGFRAVRRSYQDDRSGRGLAAVAAGSALLGSGFALAGACPGTVYAQLGAGVGSAPLVLAGAAAGVAVFTLAEPWLKRHLFGAAVVEKKGVEHHLGAGFPALAATTSAAMLLASAAFAKYAPHAVGYGAPVVPFLVDPVAALTARAWAPWSAGLLIGLSQLPSLLLTRQPLGTSSAFVALLSPLGTLAARLGLIDPKTEVAACNFPSRKALNQIAQLAAMVVGAYAAARLGGTLGVAAGVTGPGAVREVAHLAVARSAPLVPAWLGGAAQAALGGAALFIGARTAKGCTSGHGISGFALLNMVSVVAVPCMFAGGILTAFALKALA